MMPRRGLAAATVAAAFALGACTETELVVHTAKQVQAAQEQAPRGGYKVGQPYQIGGVWYYPKVDYAYRETGIASWYGPGFHGRVTANGEVFDQHQLTAAHRTLPMPSVARVTNLENGRSIKVRINDRGPFRPGRIIDVSRRGADLLGFRQKGTAKVLVEVIETESRQLAAAGGAVEAAPDAVPVLPVASASLDGGPVPAAAQTAAVPPPVNGHAVRAAAAPAALDDTVTMMPVRPTDIFVQAGSFAELDNAIRLRARLIQLGEADIAEAEVEARRFFRVRFGPLGSVADADRLLAVLVDNGYSEARVVVD